MTDRIIPSPALAAALKAYGIAYGRAERYSDFRWQAERDATEQALLATIEADAERALREGIEAGERERSPDAWAEPDGDDGADVASDDGPRLHIPRDLLTRPEGR